MSGASLVARLVAQIEYAMEGEVLNRMADAGCIQCTVGTVPNDRNTGLCAYHEATRLIAQSDEQFDELADDRHEDEDPIEPLAVTKLLAAMHEACNLLQSTDCDLRHNAIIDVLQDAIDMHGAAAIAEAVDRL